MATDSAARSVTNTLSGSTADTITLTQAWDALDVTNYDSTNYLYLRQDGTTAVAEANDTTAIPPGTSKVIDATVTGSGTVVISIVGNGGKYTIEGVN